MQIVVPYSTDDPKSRLSSILTRDEREEFSRAMCLDVCETIERSGHQPVILSNGQVDTEYDSVIDQRPLTKAVNAHLQSAGLPLGIVMADLCLITVESIERLVATDGEVVLAPGRGGGSNAFVLRVEDFQVDYHGASYLDHRSIARSLDVSLRLVDSYRLGTDIDEPDDLVEVLIHGTGQAKQYLESIGFAIDETEGRVVASR